ncbi:MAG: hypothetical protein ABI760_08615 [Ferruginibacter sp.]
MELKDLKSDWQNAGKAFKSEADLLSMTKIINHPTLKRIRIKLIAETIFLLLFLVIYYDWFDGDKKPFYANILLVTGVLLYVANDILGYISMVKPINGLNLKLSIKNYLTRIKRLSVFSLIFSSIYSIFLIIYFLSAINLTKEKGFLLLGLAIILFQLMFWSYRVWTNRIKSLKQQVKDFDADEDK